MEPNCEYCIYYTYDEEFDEYYCQRFSYLDEDEARLFYNSKKCRYFRPGDDYTIVKKQI